MKKGNNEFTVALNVTETGLTLSSRFAGLCTTSDWDFRL
jgi:hypothetical protein